MTNKNVMDFVSFLNESKRDDLKIIVFRKNRNFTATTKEIEKICKERGIEYHKVDISNTILEKAYNGHMILCGEKKIFISPDSTVIIPRLQNVEDTQVKTIFHELNKSRYFILSSEESIKNCKNKYTTSKMLEEHNLPVPKYSLVPELSFLDKALENIGNKFPVVIKTLNGSHGIGVSIVDSYISLKSIYQTLKKIDPNQEILIQEKIESDFDIRVHVLIKRFNIIKDDINNETIIGVMKRKTINKDFRTNYSLGGEVESFELTPELEKIAKKAARVLECHWSGVDIMIDKRTKKPYILEVNSMPGTEGIGKVLGEGVILNKVVDYVSDKSNWSYDNIEIGYLEAMDIDGVGKGFVAKFDTGNGSNSCSIHADTVEEKNGKVYWTSRGKKYVHDLEKYIEVTVGQVLETRPVIKLDVVFNGILVKGVNFAPLNREGKTEILVNRKFMKKLGLVVSSEKKFVLTEKPETED